MPQLNSEFFGLVWFGFLFGFIFFYKMIYCSLSRFVSLNLLTRSFFFSQVFYSLKNLFFRMDIEIEFLTFFFISVLELVDNFFLFIFDICYKFLFCNWFINFLVSNFGTRLMGVNGIIYSFWLFNLILMKIKMWLMDG